MKKATAILLALLLVIAFTGCGSSSNQGEGEVAEKTHLVFADVGWDSILFHNAVAGTVAEIVFGYTWEEVSGSTPITSEALKKNEIDVHMEMWSDNLATYASDIESGAYQELSVNFDDNYQGFYVPRYVIEGDPERGIEASAPDLKTVEDLAKYAHLFPDLESPGKGRIYGGIPGWDITEIMGKKVEYYGLDEYYNYVLPGSDAALNAAIVSAWDKGIPIVTYYWEPTWLMGMYDFVLLEDAPYEGEEAYKEGRTECPPIRVTVCVSNEFYQSNPEFCEFLKKYRTSSALTSEALAHIQQTGDDYKATAKWFLQNHPELIEEWLTPEQAEVLKAGL
ncbi:MAG: ABC transporter substrate-binding protein [Christensenellales bacterium]|jgi:glycine betaine/proline transport system substrate-binding protein